MPPAHCGLGPQSQSWPFPGLPSSPAHSSILVAAGISLWQSVVEGALNWELRHLAFLLSAAPSRLGSQPLWASVSPICALKELDCSQYFPKR